MADVHPASHDDILEFPRQACSSSSPRGSTFGNFSPSGSPRVTRGDAVTDWNLIASNSIVVTAAQPPPVSVLSFAMVQGAVYDAVNAIDRGHEPYLVHPPSHPTDSKEAAAATAAFRVLAGLFPDQLPVRCSRSTTHT